MSSASDDGNNNASKTKDEGGTVGVKDEEEGDNPTSLMNLATVGIVRVM